MINLLYCFDENYDVQAFLSIKSFVEHNNQQINIYVIHKNPHTFSEYEEKISKLSNVNLKVKKFENKKEIPLIVNDAHYSEATYYRIFLEDYLDSKTEDILYLDPDIICLKDIGVQYEEIIKKLIINKYVLGAKTDGKQKDAPELFKKLNMKNKYFNAGVMFINLNEWKKIGLTKKLQNKILELGDNLSLADQDALNSYFDGDFLEIGEEFNYYANHKANTETIEHINRNVNFLHYVGSTKPWTLYGGLSKISNFYHWHHLDAFDRYHIRIGFKKADILTLIRSIFNLKILHIDKPLLYVFNFLNILIKKDQ